MRLRLGIEPGPLSNEELLARYAEALWIEEREIELMAAAIAKAIAAE